MISLKDLITSSGKYPERAKAMTPEVQANMEAFLPNLAMLTVELKLKDLKISSGFRPPEVNDRIPGAAPKSLHMVGKAVDIVDFDGKIKHLVANHPELLRKYGLWMESGEFTPGWCHIDCGSRTDRPSRQFKP